MRSRLAKQLSALCLVTAFLLSTLLPFFAVYQLPSSTSVQTAQTEPSDSIFNKTILLCTAEGFKLVKWSDLISGKETPKPHPTAKCPLCYVATKKFSPASPDTVILAAAPTAESLIIPQDYDTPVEEDVYYHHYPSQAPPVSAG